MKKLLFFLSSFLLLSLAHGQTNFYSTVRIEYEKTVYVRQLFKALEPEWYDQIKDQLPESSASYFEWTGDTTRSLYRPGKEMPYDPRNWWSGIADKNVVYNDYRTGTTITQKPVFEETFLVQDSLTPIRWKLTADTRNIAGFDCRKAIGFIDDSIALFAFYTDEILVSGGPESAHGLPGMILGLGMPRIHTTWFATRVEVTNVDMRKLAPASKGKKVNRQTMIGSLGNVLKNWGNYGKNLVWNFVI